MTDLTEMETERKPSAQARYNASAKGKARRTRYRRTKSKWETDASYLSRPFLAWDGEGITVESGEHLYIMLANSQGGYIADPSGLSTRQCLDFVLSESAKYEGSINVIYGGGYDFNCWLADCNEDELALIWRKQFARLWESYRINWRAGKSFNLSNGEEQVTVYDVVSFFQCAFVKACDDYLGNAFTHRDMIVSNKALRSSFTEADIPDVKRYNEAELENLVSLMTELRARLNRVNLRPRRWDGPGAIASALLTRENVKDAKAESANAIAEACRYAYAGGRFEVIRYGTVEADAYEYDVNSAYPSALRSVPNLQRGSWNYHSGDCGDKPFSLYHVRYSDGPNFVPAPFFRRSENGTICYPPNVTGWYWSPEIAVARDYVKLYGGNMEILEVWEFVEDNSEDRPFGFIEPLYSKRQALKKGGDGAHVGIKLALNSLYGKLAQQVGWQPARGSIPERIPPFHQLEWAGFTTSHCRASVLRACLSDLSAVIAFETDAVFTSRPLDVPTGSQLGEFEYSQFTSLTYIQSGLYFGTLSDGTIVNKTRGVDRGTLTRDDVLQRMLSPIADDQYADARLTRFIGAGLALSQSFERWRRWETSPKRLRLTPQGKRTHDECSECGPEAGLTPNVWHKTYCPFFEMEHSAEFPIEWINPDPNMQELSELREGVTEYD